MALNGTAFLALWNEFDPARDDEYSIWHTFEHVPERVGIDGVLSGRRYAAREREHWRYFTLYELSGLDALAGASYMDVVDRPTEWSASMRPSFRPPLARIIGGGAPILSKWGLADFPVSVARRRPTLPSTAHRGRIPYDRSCSGPDS